MQEISLQNTKINFITYHSVPSVSQRKNTRAVQFSALPDLKQPTAWQSNSIQQQRLNCTYSTACKQTRLMLQETGFRCLFEREKKKVNSFSCLYSRYNLTEITSLSVNVLPTLEFLKKASKEREVYQRETTTTTICAYRFCFYISASEPHSC